MEEDLRKLLEENIKISKANNKMLRGMRRHQRVASALKIIYWLVILIVIFGGYYYIMKPLLTQLLGVYTDLSATVSGVQNATNSVTNVGGDVTNLLGDWFGGNSQ